MQKISLDNFFEGEFTPNEVRDLGLSLFKRSKNLITDKNSGFPGLRIAVPLNINKYVKNKVSDLVSILLEDEKILVEKNGHWHISYHLTTNIHEQGLIHTDIPTCIAGVIYLNPNPPKNSGTKFYRMKKKYEGIYCGITPKIKNYSKSNVTENNEFLANFGREKEYYNKKYYEEVENNENVYNSLILYPGKYPHSADQYFGETLENSRLSIVIFANVKNPLKYINFNDPFHIEHFLQMQNLR